MADWKVPSPLPRKMLTVPSPELATAMSILPSLLKSATASAEGRSRLNNLQQAQIHWKDRKWKVIR